MSIVTTFREAVIKVEVANFGAAIDTLIDQDGPDHDLEVLGLAFHHKGPTVINAYIVKQLQNWLIEIHYYWVHNGQSGWMLDEKFNLKFQGNFDGTFNWNFNRKFKR